MKNPTGRLSICEPEFQDLKNQNADRSKENHVFIDCDYDSLEMKMMAFLLKYSQFIHPKYYPYLARIAG